MSYKNDFRGTGNMTTFCDETNKLFTAMNNVSFTMPSGYAGVEPTVKFYDDKIEFDFGNMLVFTLNNVEWDLTGGATYTSYEVGVINGHLVISVVAT